MGDSGQGRADRQFDIFKLGLDKWSYYANMAKKKEEGSGLFSQHP